MITSTEKVLRRLATAVLAVALLLLPTAASAATDDPFSDVTAPVVSGVVVDAGPFDVSLGSAVVSGSMVVSDDLSGVDRGLLTFESPSGAVLRTLFSDGLVGSDLSLSTVLPQFSESGFWVVRGGSVLDNVGNQRDLTEQELIDLGVTGFYVVSRSVTDTDGDGIPDGSDNCLETVNFDQADIDGDGIGDLCDDVTPPLVFGELVPTANAAGWSNDPAAAIEWTATDPGFSLGPETFAVPSDTPAEGALTYTSAEVCDLQGNCATGTIDVQLDLTPPTLTLIAPADGAVVLVDDYVAPTCTGSDGLSGLDGTCSLQLTELSNDTGSQVLELMAQVRDLAGNETNAVRTYTVVSDIDAPTIEATPDREPNDSGWYAEAVTYAFVCEDPGSGVAFCPSPVTVATDGAGQSFDVSALDNAGNEGSLSVAGLNIDSVPPTITFEGATIFSLTDEVVVGCTASDDLSGIADTICPTLSGVRGIELGAGSHTLLAVATDIAGNETNASFTFVVEVDEGGFEEVALELLGNRGLVNALVVELAKPNGLAGIASKLDAQCCGSNKRLTQAERDLLYGLAEAFYA